MIDNTTQCNTDIEHKHNSVVLTVLKLTMAALCILVFVYSICIYIYASYNMGFAEKYTVSVSANIRESLATIAELFPFSVAETCIIIIIPALILLTIRVFVLEFAYKERGRILRFSAGLSVFLMLIASLFINAFGICYKRYRVSDILGVDTNAVTKEDITTAAMLTANLTSLLSYKVPSYPDGSTYMPYTFDEMCEKISYGYSKVLVKMPSTVSLKKIASSDILTHTHISGVYFPFTGESNVNTNYPDYVMAFSAAHEVAHQLGFAHEDDANMMAFLACMYSEDDYLFYSAVLNMTEYLFVDVPDTEKGYVAMLLNRNVINEIAAYHNFYLKYDNDSISKLSSDINSSYLKMQGVSEGTGSYMKINELFTAYMKLIYPELFTKNPA